MTYRGLLAKLAKTAGPWEDAPGRVCSRHPFGLDPEAPTYAASLLGPRTHEPLGKWMWWHSGGNVNIVLTRAEAREQADAALLAAGWTLIDDLDAEAP